MPESQEGLIPPHIPGLLEGGGGVNWLRLGQRALLFFITFIFFLITKLAPFILTHLKKLSTGNKCRGRLAARAEALEQLSGSFALTQGSASICVKSSVHTLQWLQHRPQCSAGTHRGPSSGLYHFYLSL